MSTFLRTLAFTALAVGAIACVPQDGGYYGNRGDRGGKANSCRYAYDGRCDEGRYGGTNDCDDGTDTADCRPYAQQRNRDRNRDRANSCRYANDGRCDEGR